MNTADIAQMLGVTRPHVTNKLTKRAGFPAPVINDSQKTRLWLRSSVMDYLNQRGSIKPRRQSRAATSSAVVR